MNELRKMRWSPGGRDQGTARLWSALFLALGITTLLSAHSSAAEEPAESPSIRVRPLPAPGDAAWSPLRFRSIETQTRFDLVRDPKGRPAYRAESVCGASAMRIALPNDLTAANWPRIAWRWRVEEPLDGEFRDEKTKAGDDFAARVYVLFPFEPEKSGRLARMQRGLGKRIFGVEMPGNTINYVWSRHLERGESWTSPHHDDARMIVLAQSGTVGAEDWQESVIDWSTDAQRLFSEPPSRAPYALAIMSDADGSCSRAVSWFSDFRLLGPPARNPLPSP